MNKSEIIDKINEYLRIETKLLCKWLDRNLPQISQNWWSECVIQNLTENQKNRAVEKRATSLEDLDDMPIALHVAEKNRIQLSGVVNMSLGELEPVRSMKRVRTNWVYLTSFPPRESVLDDLGVMLKLLKLMGASADDVAGMEKFIADVENSEMEERPEDTSGDVTLSASGSGPEDDGIAVNSEVYLVSDPSKTGVVMSIKIVDGTKCYDVFMGNSKRQCYEGQIRLLETTNKKTWTGLREFLSYLTAYQINNPSATNLYSLNSARIDFVSYQFRPALKLIKSDKPRILIADSVGVGKTIEAGLIIKELEARHELERILVICPKPLVVERKWELEMKRFDEYFVPLQGAELKKLINDTDTDGEWPSRYGRCIIPYSILDDATYNGSPRKNAVRKGLVDLDPKPHFDLVIVDEAHHIRNGSMQKEKAFAYKCVSYFCENSDAVVMLTATPLQTSNNDLFTLLNIIRPDIVIDTDTFSLMSEPNAYISECSHILRSPSEDWQEEALEKLTGLKETDWGRSVISTSSLYKRVVEKLKEENLTNEDRVSLIDSVESLHSFNNIMNRTRRKDIENFCVRRTTTLEMPFTDAQRTLHDSLLNFCAMVYEALYGDNSVNFMLSTMRKLAASCIFGLAPFLRDILNHQLHRFLPDMDVEDDVELKDDALEFIRGKAKEVLALADNLPEEDPKFDDVLGVIEEKQKEENNKIILFSSFRHTLEYVRRKLFLNGYRVGQIDGSVKDEDRLALRNRFALDRKDEKAIDILLFTEVGAEGLDYQFCNMMVNYDLPWNPMKIEQRIGRIDRHGQKSEVVHIFNVITSGTIDAEIYSRCLMRIGVFEHSIGECEVVLGDIAHEIEQIALNNDLTDEERSEKLQQLADNRIRKEQELEKLENEQKSLFGFDLSSYIASKEISDAENPWLSPANVFSLVEKYMKARIDGESSHILGGGDKKTLRISYEARVRLRDDYIRLPGSKTDLNSTTWDKYLKGVKPELAITFDQACARENPDVQFITLTHPLVKQAAMYFKSTTPAYVRFKCATDDVLPGEYPFVVYLWKYDGINGHVKLQVVCQNSVITEEWNDLILNACSDIADGGRAIDDAVWEPLESIHLSLWRQEKEKHLRDVGEIVAIRISSLRNSYNTRIAAAEQKLSMTTDASVKRMLTAQIVNDEEKMRRDTAEQEDHLAKADIESIRVANGLLAVYKKED